MMNPFAYERMATQPQIYLGIILIGYGLYFLLSYYENSRNRWIILASVSMGLSLAFFPHAAYMIFFVYFFYALFFLRTWKSFWYLIIGWIIILIINLNWLLAPVWGMTSSVVSIWDFDYSNLDAFQTRSLAPLGVGMTNLLLYWFWWETSHLVRPWFMSPYWYIWWSLIIIVSSIWLIMAIRVEKLRKYALSLSILGFISFVLGLGIATPWSRPIIEWAYDSLPYFRGYREPQKWIGILMIVQGIFFIIWTTSIFWSIKDIFFRYIALFFLILCLLFWSPGMMWGFRGQLTTTIYPETLEIARDSLLNSDHTGRLLILPWHSYMACDWTRGKVVANSLSTYFSPIQTTVADNIEMIGKLYSNSQSKESAIIEWFLSDSWFHNIKSIQDLGFTNILIMKTCASLDTFPWIETIAQCQKKYDDSAYILYTCE
jgi:hypothetical protein